MGVSVSINLTGLLKKGMPQAGLGAREGGREGERGLNVDLSIEARRPEVIEHTRTYGSSRESSRFNDLAVSMDICVIWVALGYSLSSW